MRILEVTNPQLFYAISSIIVSRRGEVCVGWMEGFFKLKLNASCSIVPLIMQHSIILLFCRRGALAKTTSIYSCFKAHANLSLKRRPIMLPS